MANGSFINFLVFHLLLHWNLSSFTSLCIDSRAPFAPKSPLVFCPYSGSVCCDSVEDLPVKKRFQALNISDSSCSPLLKSIRCAECDPSCQKLYTVNKRTQTLLHLCNSSASATGFCEKLWDACQNVSIKNSPFAPSVHGRGGVPSGPVSSKLTDLWHSQELFCEAFGGTSDNSVCFNGESVSQINAQTLVTPKGLCLERIANGSYLDMIPHPDGSNRVFMANQQGQIWLVTIPEEGEILSVDESNPFLDLTNIVKFEGSLGLMSIAFHPNFARNGRFFVSFNCDKLHWPDCSGRCSCNTDVNCDPSKLKFQNGVLPCQYHSVIAEFTANGTATPSLATRANPSEVRRIFTMGLPSTGNHAGQILFGPEDGYLYFTMGDGAEGGDPYNFAQNKKSLLGKIMRFDIDSMPSVTEISLRGFWGNYTVPRDNPYSSDKDFLPEIWALGLRNPWRCSFDSIWPSYFICGDCGQNQYEEVDFIEKGANYGWRVYEGPYIFNPPKSPGGNTSASSIKTVFPVMGYNHSSVSSDPGSASITGGFIYRSKTDPCMYGRYLFTDLYAGSIWVGTETQESSMNFGTSQLLFSCAHDTPIECVSVEKSSTPSLGYIFSMAQDHKNDLYILTSEGVYRVSRPSRCNYNCSQENATNGQTKKRVPSSTSSSNYWQRHRIWCFIMLSSFLLLIM